jgi:L-threonylcarbamoyladenylate synthase
VPARATAGRSTIAVRSPAHPVARALLEAVGQPISAPSANRSGHVSPTAAQHVMDEFADVSLAHDLLILDGGPCDVGIESTVLDLSQPEQPRILRPGAVTLEQLQEILGEVDAPNVIAQHASPGTSPLHYAPATPAELVAPRELQNILERYEREGVRCAVLCFDATTAGKSHAIIRMPHDSKRYAHDIYARLRDADALACDRIVVEAPPADSDLWRAVHDRLHRATARSLRDPG